MAKSQQTISVDTLEVYDDSYLAEVTQYLNGSKTKKYQARLYPITIKRPKYRLLGNLILHEVKVDSITQKLMLEQYETNGDYTLTSKSTYGVVTKSYFDSTGAPMNFEEYESKHGTIIICGNVEFEFLMYGTKKKR